MNRTFTLASHHAGPGFEGIPEEVWQEAKAVLEDKSRSLVGARDADRLVPLVRVVTHLKVAGVLGASLYAAMANGTSQ